MLKNLFIATAIAASLNAFAKVEKIEVDTSASKIVYVGKKVTGQHTGEVKIANGFLNFDNGTLKGGEFEADMTSITNTDITDPEYHGKFLGHMKSDDFFSVDKFKTSKLVITKAEKGKGNSYKVTGDLTIKGKTAPVTFDAEATKEAATAKLIFDRTKYDIKYGSGKFFQGLGDKMIHDEVELTVNLKMKK